LNISNDDIEQIYLNKHEQANLSSEIHDLSMIIVDNPGIV